MKQVYIPSSDLPELPSYLNRRLFPVALLGNQKGYTLYRTYSPFDNPYFIVTRDEVYLLSIKGKVIKEIARRDFIFPPTYDQIIFSDTNTSNRYFENIITYNFRGV